jgi:DNA adenine methylase
MNRNQRNRQLTAWYNDRQTLSPLVIDLQRGRRGRSATLALPNTSEPKINFPSYKEGDDAARYLSKVLGAPIRDRNSQGRIVGKRTSLVKSPLRYPGGKSRAVDAILPLIPPNEREIVSPFFGGGSIELACASNGATVFGYDIFQPLVSFWQELLHDPLKLSKTISEYHPLKKKDFYDLQKELPKIKSRHEQAAIFYVINRSSYSGSTASGGMSPDHPRFTQSSIDRVRDFAVKNLTVGCLDFKDALAKHPNALAYLDPPYIKEGLALYGVKGSTHKGFDHSGLRDILLGRDKWILSYDDCAEIRKMYEGYAMMTPEWKYGMSSDKTSKEILVLSKDIGEFAKKMGYL